MNSSWTFHGCGLCMKPWIIYAYVFSWILHELLFHEIFMNKSHFLFTSFTWSLHDVTSWIVLEYLMNTSWRMTKHFTGVWWSGELSGQLCHNNTDKLVSVHGIKLSQNLPATKTGHYNCIITRFYRHLQSMQKTAGPQHRHLASKMKLICWYNV